MEALRTVFTTCLVILTVGLHIAEGIKCWHCNTKLDGHRCGDPFDVENSGFELLDCNQWAADRNSSHQPDACYKITQHQIRIVNNEETGPDYANITSRGCGYAEGNRGCTYIDGTSVGGYNCVCTESSCNGASRVGQTYVYFIYIFVAMVLMKFH